MKGTWSGSPASLPSGGLLTGPKQSRRSPSLPTLTILREWRPGWRPTPSYDPPNLTYPFGSYICALDIDKGTGEVKIRRFVAVDDCGNIINPHELWRDRFTVA